MQNADGTYTCDYEGCSCRVADDETHVKSEDGGIYCSSGCRDGAGCTHDGCNCRDGD